MRTDPFYGIGDFPPAVSIAASRRLAVETLLRPKPDTRVTGFKEIRWWRHEDLDAYVGWLREVFPGARFLVNTRDHAAVLKSKWWAKGGDNSEHLADIERACSRPPAASATRRTTCTSTTTSPTPPPSPPCSRGWARQYDEASVAHDDQEALRLSPAG
jgi:hypothetical protein